MKNLKCFAHLDPPDPPRNVKFADWDSDRMDLIWDVPLSDHGAPITHYVIEMRTDKAGEAFAEIGKQIRLGLVALKVIYGFS